jgi:hypothetical protein
MVNGVDVVVGVVVVSLSVGVLLSYSSVPDNSGQWARVIPTISYE